MDGVRVLDAGWAIAALLSASSRRGTRLVTIDLSDSVITDARARLGVGFVGGRAALESLPFRNGAFDAVVCVDMIMHVDDEAAALRELSRVVRRGGRLILSFNSLLSPFSLLAIVNNRLVRRGIPKLRARMPSFYVRRLARSGIRVRRAVAATVVCVDPAIAPLRRLRLRFLPGWFLSLLMPIDRRLTEGVLKWFGHEVVLECERLETEPERI